jgi:hypothetical protein
MLRVNGHGGVHPCTASRMHKLTAGVKFFQMANQAE